MPDFSIFDMKLGEEKKEELPDWPEFSSGKNVGIAKKMYFNILARRDDIKTQLNNGVELKTRQKKILATDISESVGKNKYYLNAREFPTLKRFIDETNDALSRIQPTGAEFSRPKRVMGRTELVNRVSFLEKRLETENFSKMLDSQILNQFGSTRQNLIEAQKEIIELTEKLALKRKSEVDLIDQISTLFEELQALRNQLEELGVKPNPQKYLKVVK
ncbi:MAG: hypothetical protein JJ879_04230 [Sneathiella sp.]|nr:hypothetical protein [Sneathiella sp.]